MSVDKRLKEVNREIKRVDPMRARRRTYALVAVICIAVILGAVYLGPGITGFVTFSQTTTQVGSEDFTVTEPGEVTVRADIDTINAILLSGTVYGEGTASIFLKKGDRKILAYHYEGYAEGGVDFTDMCYGTCHVEDLGRDNTLIFELDGTIVHIDRIKYMYSKIIDFDLLPEQTLIDYNTEKARIVNLRLTNDQLTDYKVIFYIDGPLSDYMSYNASIVHVTPEDQEKNIAITVKLPGDLPAGIYDHKVTARFIPPTDLDFQGATPTEEAFITIENS